MKKRLAMLLAVVMLFSLLPGTALSEIHNVRISDDAVLTANVFGIEVGKTNEVMFTAKTGIAGLGNVSVCDSDGNFITTLSERQGGVYEGSAVLSATQSGSEVFHAEVYGKSFGSHEINYYVPSTMADYALNDLIWNRIEELEANMKSSDASNSAILEAVYELLLHSSNVESLWYESDTIINFNTVGGIGNVYTILEDGVKGSEADGDINREFTVPEAMRDLVDNCYVDSVDIGIYSPCYGIDYSFTFDYYQSVLPIAEYLDGDIYAYYGNGNYSYQGTQFGASTINSFKEWGNYGLIMIDSHGTLYNNKSYICVPMSVAGIVDQIDISEQHIVRSGSYYYVTGTFIQKYCDALPNSIVYLGICEGMSTEALSGPILAHGALVVTGYVNSVTFAYEDLILESMTYALVATNPDTGEQYTAGEMFDYVCEQNNGGVDNFTAIQPAVFTFRGNVNTVLLRALIPVNSVSVEPASSTIYINNTLQLEYTVDPVTANRYTIAWESSDESVATVNEQGVVTAVASGTVDITCVLSQEIGKIDNIYQYSTYTGTASIVVDGVMPVTSVSVLNDFMTAYVGADYMLFADVLPANASYTDVLWSVSDDTVAEVEGDVLRPLAEGTVVLTAESFDGLHMDYMVVDVIEPDLDVAVNAVGGQLEFSNSLQYPWVIDYTEAPNTNTTRGMPGKICAVSSNKGIKSSSSTITLNAGQVYAGSALSFSWKVSSEENADRLIFKVNGVQLDSTSYISGERDWEKCTILIDETADYVFSWEYKKDSTLNIGQDCGWVSDIDLWRAEASYNVVFLDRDSSPLFVEDVLHGCSANAPAAPTYNGYLFVAWDKDFSNVRSDMEIRPVYVPVREDLFTVTFYDWDNSIIATEFVAFGYDATPPNSPTRENYVFMGWSGNYTDVFQDEEVYAVYALLGDANADGKLDSGDVSCILQHVIKLRLIADDYLKVADVNSDGKLNTGDAAITLEIILWAQ